ncbi:MAG: alkaline phosphatase [Candidatus Corynebacterium faecigallinarum]
MSHRRRTTASLCAIASTVSLTAVFLPAAAAQDLPAPGSSDVASSIESSLPGSHVPDLTGTDGPKNIIYLVGDGMGYNHIAATNLFETGQTKHQVEGEAGDVSPVEGGEAAQVYEGDEWNELAMSTFQEGNSYDPEKAWNDHDYVNEDYTDSAAAGTAMATSSKTENGMIGVTSDGATVQNTSEHAIDNGKSAGVVSSVPFNHATPAAWAAHNDDRNDFHAMADEMIGGDLDVIMGAGHPLYDEDNQPVDEPNYEWISEESFTELSAGETDFTYLEEDADFQTLADGDVEAGEKYFGLPQVASTLQHNRSGDSAVPYDTELNDVVDMSTMAEGALNILDQNDEGFHVMIEGGVIDWAGHANDAGPTDDPSWSAMTGQAGEMPEHSWHSENHTNQLVPVFFRGGGAARTSPLRRPGSTRCAATTSTTSTSPTSP